MRAFWKTTVAIGALLASPALADPAITVTPDSGRPDFSIQVSGRGFAPREKVDLFFDGAELRRAKSNGAGNFPRRMIKVPLGALPGMHTVSAVGRKDGDAAQAQFLVTTHWHEFGFTAAGARYNAYENVLDAPNAGTLALVQKINFGMGSTWDYTDSPIYAGADLIYIGNSKGDLTAFGVDGSTKWTFNTSGQIQTTPASVNGITYIASEDGNIYALNAETGAQVWNRPIESGDSAPAVSNGVVYAFGYAGGDYPLYAFDALTGSQAWSVSGLGQVLSSPTVADGVVYVAAVNNLYALDAATGSQLWKINFNGDVSSPAVVNGVIYVGGEDHKLYAYDAVSGAQLWTASLGNSTFIYASPAVANGAVYLGGGDGVFHAFDASTGAELWSARLGDSVESSAAVANGVVYVGSDDSHVYAFDAVNGTPLWSYALTGQMRGSPVVADGMLIAASIDGKLWEFAPGGTAAVRKRKAARPSFAQLLHSSQKPK